MKVKVTRVIKKDKKDDGSPLTDKNGNLYVRVAIKYTGSEEWFSANLKSTKQREWNIEEGKEYSIATSASAPTADGKIFHNFKLLSDTEVAVDRILERLTAIENHVFRSPPTTASVSAPAPAQEEQDDSEPF